MGQCKKCRVEEVGAGVTFSSSFQDKQNAGWLDEVPGWHFLTGNSHSGSSEVSEDYPYWGLLRTRMRQCRGGGSCLDKQFSWCNIHWSATATPSTPTGCWFVFRGRLGVLFLRWVVDGNAPTSPCLLNVTCCRTTVCFSVHFFLDWNDVLIHLVWPPLYWSMVAHQTVFRKALFISPFGILLFCLHGVTHDL